MSSARRSSSGTGSIRGSFFNQKPGNNTQRISSHTSSQRKSSNRTLSNRSSSGRTSSQKKRARSSSQKNYIPVLDFKPENEDEIKYLKSVVKSADELRRNNGIMNDEKIFDDENMATIEKKQQSIKERTKDLLRQRQLITLIKKTEGLYLAKKADVNNNKSRFFNNSKLRKDKKLMNDYGKQLNYLYSQIDIIDQKLETEKTDPNELLKDIKLLNKRIDVENQDESNPKHKYYDDKFLTRKYNKSLRKRGGRCTRRRK